MCPEIITIIFSKNRACQLELLLRNLSIPAIVLYTCSPEFHSGYDKVVKMYPRIKFVLQTDFNKQLTELILSGKYVMFFVDDDVMIEPFYEDCAEFREFKQNQEIISLSLNLCPKYKYRGLPILDNNKWEWKPYSHRAKGFTLRIWGHPMTVTSHVFRSEDILRMISLTNITTPNYLEKTLVENEYSIERPLMLCFDKPKTINNNANQVQTDFPSRTLRISPEELECRFLNGERLSLEHMKLKAAEAKFYRMMIPYEYERFQ